ncbi:MAG: DUF4278 domain-containing protein [Synechococcaceae cyanobacterium SM2_3_1]|nr:DUF4278 domain-containing protein [Synechococcaceae cyanobacterium SM2_3_1]
MELTYRGVTHFYDPDTIEIHREEVTGRFRGQELNWRAVTSVALPEAILNLQFRGVPLRASQVEATSLQQVQPQLRTKSLHPLQQNFIDQVAELHRRNILLRLQQRLQAAKARGDDNLVQLLEAEQQQMA